jgi:hypothetical protein
LGSSNGIQLAINVTVSGASGLTNAYRSVLSARGSPAISGASRWLDAPAPNGPVLVANSPPSSKPLAPIAVAPFHFLDEPTDVVTTPPSSVSERCFEAARENG